MIKDNAFLPQKHKYTNGHKITLIKSNCNPKLK